MFSASTGGESWPLFLAEGAFLGLAGAALGVAGGWLLARAVVGSVTRTVSSFYLSSLASTAAAELRLDLPTVAGGLAFGLIVALISSAIPAREAAGISPVEFLRAGSLETKRRGGGPSPLSRASFFWRWPIRRRWPVPWTGFPSSDTSPHSW